MSPRDEGELLDQTIALAILRRWAAFHPRPAMLSDGQWRTALKGHKGFPDLVLARDGVVLFRELKGPTGRVSSEQRDWGRQIQPGWAEADPGYLGRNGFGWAFDVWRPADWETIIVPTLCAPRRTDHATTTGPPGYPAPNVAPH